MPIMRLTDIPDHLIDRSPVKPGIKWRTEYNVAAWLRFEAFRSSSVKLYLVWTDDRGKQRHLVDTSAEESISTLLSGAVSLPIVGKIKTMHVEVESLSTNIQVDELFVQPAKKHRTLSQAKTN